MDGWSMENCVDNSVIRRVKLVHESGIQDVWSNLQQFYINKESANQHSRGIENASIRSNILMQFALLALGLTVLLANTDLGSPIYCRVTS